MIPQSFQIETLMYFFWTQTCQIKMKNLSDVLFFIVIELTTLKMWMV